MRPLLALLALAAAFLLMGCASSQGAAEEGQQAPAQTQPGPEGQGIGITGEDLSVEELEVELEDDLPVPEPPS